MKESEEPHWLVRPKTLRWLWRGGVSVLVLLFFGDYFVHGHDSFGLEDIFGFFAWFGIIACLGLVLIAKLLGVLLKRKDRYYDD